VFRTETKSGDLTPNQSGDTIVLVLDVLLLFASYPQILLHILQHCRVRLRPSPDGAIRSTPPA